jgi:hypothetical protein
MRRPLSIFYSPAGGGGHTPTICKLGKKKIGLNETGNKLLMIIPINAIPQFYAERPSFLQIEGYYGMINS